MVVVLLVQLPAHIPSSWVHNTHMRFPDGARGFDWPSPEVGGHLGSKPADRRSLSFCHFAFQIRCLKKPPLICNEFQILYAALGNVTWSLHLVLFPQAPRVMLPVCSSTNIARLIDESMQLD